MKIQTVGNILIIIGFLIITFFGFVQSLNLDEMRNHNKLLISESKLKTQILNNCILENRELRTKIEEDK